MTWRHSAADRTRPRSHFLFPLDRWHHWPSRNELSLLHQVVFSYNVYFRKIYYREKQWSRSKPERSGVISVMLTVLRKCINISFSVLGQPALPSWRGLLFWEVIKLLTRPGISHSLTALEKTHTLIRISLLILGPSKQPGDGQLFCACGVF